MKKILCTCREVWGGKRKWRLKSQFEKSVTRHETKLHPTLGVISLAHSKSPMLTHSLWVTTLIYTYYIKQQQHTHHTLCYVMLCYVMFVSVGSLPCNTMSALLFPLSFWAVHVALCHSWIGFWPLDPYISHSHTTSYHTYLYLIICY